MRFARPSAAACAQERLFAVGDRRYRALAIALAGAVGIGAAASAACSRITTSSPDIGPPQVMSAIVTAPSATAPGAPRPGMAWIPSGVLRAGTPDSRFPRIPDEELPGTEIPLSGFYIDLLPFPNEAGAIPTANVTRDEAARLCETRGKRLCTELEWERACKGESNTMYEYGEAYRSAVCGTGVAVEQTARRPTGERPACESAFGVREMHGGVWEWTDSTWQRGGASHLGVLKGGSAVAGEIAGKCSNAIARPPYSKSQTMGFRCCGGPRNEGVVHIPLLSGSALDRVFVPKADPTWGPAEWVWRPVRNEEIRFRGECTDDAPIGIQCVCRVFRPTRDGAEPSPDIARIETGKALCGILEPARDPKDLRMIYMDRFARSRTVRYAYGRVEVSEPH